MKWHTHGRGVQILRCWSFWGPTWQLTDHSWTSREHAELSWTPNTARHLMTNNTCRWTCRVYNHKLTYPTEIWRNGSFRSRMGLKSLTYRPADSCSHRNKVLSLGEREESVIIWAMRYLSVKHFTSQTPWLTTCSQATVMNDMWVVILQCINSIFSTSKNSNVNSCTVVAVNMKCTNVWHGTIITLQCTDLMYSSAVNSCNKHITPDNSYQCVSSLCRLHVTAQQWPS